MEKIPVYLFTGFMDSGKTKLIKDTLIQQEFTKNSNTLLLVCEDGEEEYDEELMRKNQISMELIKDPSMLQKKVMQELIQKFEPDQIFIEYNGMWEVGPLLENGFLDECELYQSLACVDASTFDQYLKNMRPLIMEQLFVADVIIFNRCTTETPKTKYRTAIKGQNKKAQLVYERMDGTIDDEPEELPYDMSKEELVISDMDYAIWYTDIMDHPKDYAGKKIEFLALVYNPPGKMSKGVFIPGRFAMTCCADDVTFLGVKAKYAKSEEIPHKSFVKVRGVVKVEFAKEYHQRGPVLYIEQVEKADKPEDELIYF